MKRITALLLIIFFAFGLVFLKPREAPAFLILPSFYSGGMAVYSYPLTVEDYRAYPIAKKEPSYLLHRDKQITHTERDNIEINYSTGALFLNPFAFENKRIDYFIKYFQGKGRPHFEVWLQRSNKYIGLIKGVFHEYGLPEDLVYLAIIESGFNPKAYSRARAAGIWQFMKGTAKLYNLRIDWWLDERRDPVKSTHAAAKHLKKLYDTFDSWPLAIAAYNAGKGRIRRAVKRYKTSDIWELTKRRRLPKETKDYFPKFLAALRIVKRPDLYGFGDNRSSEPLVYDEVTVPHATDLRVIAKAGGTTLKKIKELNPALKRWFTPPNYRNYRLKIPFGKREIYLENIARIPFDRRIVFHRHKVKIGETLSHLSRQYRTSTKAIMYLNGIKNPRYLRAGKEVVIPVRGKKQRTRTAVQIKPLELQGSSFRKVNYTVRKGDNIWNIANLFGIKPASIYMWNAIDPASFIFPGDKIVLYLQQ